MIGLFRRHKSKPCLKTKDASEPAPVSPGAVSVSGSTPQNKSTLVKGRRPRNFSSCTICDLFFLDAKSLEVHYLKCLAERAKRWDEEDRRAGTSRRHSPNRTSNTNTNADELERAHCILCERYFSTASQLKYHNEDFHPPGSGPSSCCPVCEIPCDVPTHIRQAAQHRRSCTLKVQQEVDASNWPHGCMECDLILENEESAQKHMRQMRRHCRIMHERQAENADEEWQCLCWPCDRYFASEQDFLKHQQLCPSPLSFLSRLEGEILLAFSNEESLLGRRNTDRTRYQRSQPTMGSSGPSGSNSVPSRIQEEDDVPSIRGATASGPTNNGDHSRHPRNVTPTADGPAIDPFVGPQDASSHGIEQGQEQTHQEAAAMGNSHGRDRANTAPGRSSNDSSTLSTNASWRRPSRPIPPSPEDDQNTADREPPASIPQRVPEGDSTYLQTSNRELHALRTLASVLQAGSSVTPYSSRPQTLYSTLPEPATPSGRSFDHTSDRGLSSTRVDSGYDPIYISSRFTPLGPGSQLNRYDTIYSDRPEPPSPNPGLARARTSFDQAGGMPYRRSMRPQTVYSNAPPLPPKSSEDAYEATSVYDRQYAPLLPPAFIVVPQSSLPPIPTSPPPTRPLPLVSSAPPVPPRPARRSDASRPPVPSRPPPISPSSATYTVRDDLRDDAVEPSNVGEENEQNQPSSYTLPRHQRQPSSPVIVDTHGRSNEPVQPERSPDERMFGRPSPNRNRFSDPSASSPDEELPPPSYNEIIAEDQVASIQETSSPAVVLHPAVDNNNEVQNVREEDDVETQRSPSRRLQAETIPTRTRVISIIGGVSQYECPLCLEESSELSNISCGHVFCTTCIKRALQAERRCPLCRTAANVNDIRRVFF